MSQMNSRLRVVELGSTLPVQFPDYRKGALDKYSLGRLDPEKFAKTTVAVRGKDGIVRKTVDVSKRSSMTYADAFQVLHPKCPTSTFTLLKYEVGDFFTPHVDHKGRFTCLILGGTEYEGGVLKLQDDGLEVSVKPGANKYLMVIFAVDVQHEVTPVTKGVRYILKTSLDDLGNDGIEYDKVRDVEIYDGCTESEGEVEEGQGNEVFKSMFGGDDY